MVTWLNPIKPDGLCRKFDQVTTKFISPYTSKNRTLFVIFLFESNSKFWDIFNYFVLHFKNCFRYFIVNISLMYVCEILLIGLKSISIFLCHRQEAPSTVRAKIEWTWRNRENDGVSIYLYILPFAIGLNIDILISIMHNIQLKKIEFFLNFIVKVGLQSH